MKSRMSLRSSGLRLLIDAAIRPTPEGTARIPDWIPSSVGAGKKTTSSRGARSCARLEGCARLMVRDAREAARSSP